MDLHFELNDKVYSYNVHENSFRTLHYRCDLFAFSQASKGKRKVSKELDTHLMGPLDVSLSLYAYFERAFAHLKNKKSASSAGYSYCFKYTLTVLCLCFFVDEERDTFAEG